MDALAPLNSALEGRYAIDREIGAGGMATVYLARDIRHDRNVALKVLRPDLGAVLGIERFLSEIRVTANLQHPNLLPLFDSGEAGGQLFYVMPYVEGESLRARLQRDKQLPVDEAIRIATAVASALDYAHRHNVIHRDLKPENILLHEGQPLVADFGIALAVSNAGGGRITQTGLSLGTPMYMSPEQATGDRVMNAGTDIYSLGAVTYEMLVGDPPHVASTSQAVIAKVLTERPSSIRVSRPNVPEHVEAAVLHALEKLPADRFATAHEFADALQGKTNVSDATSATRARAGTPAAKTWMAAARHPLTITLAAVAALGIAGTLRYGMLARSDPARTTVRFTLDFDDQHRWEDVAAPFALSPDGKLLAYTARTGSSPRRLHVRALGELRAIEFAGTDGAVNPFFSPDGKWIGFYSIGLSKLPTAGGTAVRLANMAELPTPFNGASWAPNDEIVISSGGRLHAVPANGGPARVLAHPDTAAGETSLRWPLALADGKTLLFVSWQAPNAGLRGAKLGVMSLDGSDRKTLDLSASIPLAVVNDLLVFATVEGSISAVQFDVRSRRVIGTPIPVVTGTVPAPGGAFKGSVSPSGSLVYVADGATPGTQLSIAAPRAGARSLLPDTRLYAFPRYSPDGRHVAMAIGGERTDVWILDLPSGPLRRLTTEGPFNDRPEWTPDSRNIVFRSNRTGRNAFWIQPADGNRSAEPYYSVPNGAVDEVVLSSDGNYMIVQVDTTACNCVGTSYYRRVRGDTSLVSIAGVSRGQHTTARLSPDQRWVAYRSNETERPEVYVKPFPSLDRRSQISLAGGEQPVWSRDGRTLYYVGGNQLLSATLAFTPALSVVRRDTVVNNIVSNPLPPTSANHANYDAAPDGKSIVFLGGGGRGAKVVVVHDWKYELRNRVGSGSKP
jgi:eukaryotic-like serine/threonine-protein kinase